MPVATTKHFTHNGLKFSAQHPSTTFPNHSEGEDREALVIAPCIPNFTQFGVIIVKTDKDGFLYSAYLTKTTRSEAHSLGIQGKRWWRHDIDYPAHLRFKHFDEARRYVTEQLFDHMNETQRELLMQPLLEEAVNKIDTWLTS